MDDELGSFAMAPDDLSLIIEPEVQAEAITAMQDRMGNLKSALYTVIQQLQDLTQQKGAPPQ